MRGSRMQYRAGGPTGSDIAPPYTNDAALAASIGGDATTGRPGLVLLGLLILGMGAFAYWTR